MDPLHHMLENSWVRRLGIKCREMKREKNVMKREKNVMKQRKRDENSWVRRLSSDQSLNSNVKSHTLGAISYILLLKLHQQPAVSP